MSLTTVLQNTTITFEIFITILQILGIVAIVFIVAPPGKEVINSNIILGIVGIISINSIVYAFLSVNIPLYIVTIIAFFITVIIMMIKDA